MKLPFLTVLLGSQIPFFASDRLVEEMSIATEQARIEKPCSLAVQPKMTHFTELTAPSSIRFQVDIKDPSFFQLSEDCPGCEMYEITQDAFVDITNGASKKCQAIFDDLGVIHRGCEAFSGSQFSKKDIFTGKFALTRALIVGENVP